MDTGAGAGYTAHLHDLQFCIYGAKPMPLIKSAIIALLLAACQFCSAGTMCAHPKLTEVAADDARCYFYSGTAAYHIKNYQTAAKEWRALIALKEIPIELEYLRTDGYNNLGFLYFVGWGGKTDKQTALAFWNYAFKAGHDEAAYHLCHAYADPKEPSYAPGLARGMCAEALRRYGPREGASESAEIVGYVQKYLDRLAP
jgi:TPR repeat protein